MISKAFLWLSAGHLRSAALVASHRIVVETFLFTVFEGLGTMLICYM